MTIFIYLISFLGMLDLETKFYNFSKSLSIIFADHLALEPILLL